MAALVEAVVAVVVLHAVFASGAGHVMSTLVMAHHLGMRSRMWLAQQRSCRHPSQGQQHRQQDEYEQTEGLHGFQRSTGPLQAFVQGARFMQRPLGSAG